ncbi:hypothetical protein GCM10010116_28150 [Microbispora rosea subsp. aerata]|nr:hypothetical protein GCM10010116_28150 [Microbispora rosea subsp. aerata]GLJ84884.1 hypothetical protein GCM10017588_36120 [Microbispora rosea subsp. aerata]
MDMRILNKFFTKSVRSEHTSYLETLARQARQARDRRRSSR